MSPTLIGGSAILHFEGSDVIEIHNGITFGFCMGLPHMYIRSEEVGRDHMITTTD